VHFGTLIPALFQGFIWVILISDAPVPVILPVHSITNADSTLIGEKDVVTAETAGGCCVVMNDFGIL